MALVVDSFAVEVLNFAQEFNMSYIYYPGAANTLSLSFYLPKLDEETSCEYRDLSEPVRAPSSSASGVYLSAENSGNPLEFLPSGYLERTKEQGLVIPSWEPHIQILRLWLEFNP